MMEEHKYAKLGMLFGIFIGGGVGILLFVTTGDPIYIAFSGAGAGIGLSLGAGVDQWQKKSQDQDPS